MSRIDRLFALRDHYDLLAQRMPLKMHLGQLSSHPFTLSRAQDKMVSTSACNWPLDHLNKEGKRPCCCAIAKGSCWLK